MGEWTLDSALVGRAGVIIPPISGRTCETKPKFDAASSASGSKRHFFLLGPENQLWILSPR